MTSRKPTRADAPKRRDPLRYEAIADAYRRELRALPGGGPFSDYDLVHLRRFFGGRRLADITDESVVEYALRREEQQGAGPQTINGELRTLWAIVRFALRRGLIKQEESPRIKFRRDFNVAPARLSDSYRPLRGEALRLRRHGWFKPASLESESPATPNARGKLPPKVLAEHISQHPLGKRKADGSIFSVNDRRKRLKVDQGVDISRSQLTRRLNALR